MNRHASCPTVCINININYAVHFPILDRMFGTYHMPGDRWPDGYGVINDSVPRGYLKQFVYPFQRPKAAEADQVA